MKYRFSRRSGLTLLELLISLGLLALIMAGVASAMNFGLRLYGRSAELGAIGEEIAVRVRLRGLLSNALPPSQLAPFPVSFNGDASGFAFTTLATGGIAPQAAALRVRVNQAQDLLLNLVALDDEGTETPILELPLRKGKGAVRFAYFDASQTSGIWLSEWPDPSRLPALVQITAEEQTLAWPEFTVRPSLGQ